MEYAKFIKLLDEKIQNPDEALKQKLLKAPKETIKELIGEDVPGNVTFHTSKENTLTFIIPYEGKREMSVNDLSEVSGGVGKYPNVSRKMNIAAGYMAIPLFNDTHTHAHDIYADRW